MSGNNHNLGTNTLDGYTADMISDDFTYAINQESYRKKCLICNCTPILRLVPKYPHLDTAELQKGVYLCERCLPVSNINPDHYGIRKL